METRRARSTQHRHCTREDSKGIQSKEARCDSQVPTGSVCFSVLFCAEVEGFVDDITSTDERRKELAGIVEGLEVCKECEELRQGV